MKRLNPFNFSMGIAVFCLFALAFADTKYPITMGVLGIGAVINAYLYRND